MMVTTGTALCTADCTRVAASVEMSVANTNLCRLCRVHVVACTDKSNLFSHRGMQQRLPTRIASLLDVTIASLAKSKSTLAHNHSQAYNGNFACAMT